LKHGKENIFFLDVCTQSVHNFVHFLMQFLLSRVASGQFLKNGEDTSMMSNCVLPCFCQRMHLGSRKKQFSSLMNCWTWATNVNVVENDTCMTLFVSSKKERPMLEKIVLNVVTNQNG